MQMRNNPNLLTQLPSYLPDAKLHEAEVVGIPAWGGQISKLAIRTQVSQRHHDLLSFVVVNQRKEATNFEIRSQFARAFADRVSVLSTELDNSRSTLRQGSDSTLPCGLCPRRSQRKHDVAGRRSVSQLADRFVWQYPDTHGGLQIKALPPSIATLGHSGR
jgi:hypothetical protein